MSELSGRRRRARNARGAATKGARLDAGGRTSAHPRASAGLTRAGLARGRVGSTRARRRRGGERGEASGGQSGGPARCAAAAVRAVGVAAPTATHVDRAESHDRRAVVRAREGVASRRRASAVAARSGHSRSRSYDNSRQQLQLDRDRRVRRDRLSNQNFGFDATDRFRIITMNRADSVSSAPVDETDMARGAPQQSRSRQKGIHVAGFPALDRRIILDVARPRHRQPLRRPRPFPAWW